MTTRFNGAAFFQSGKSTFPQYQTLALIAGFNGAAFFQSGKYVSATSTGRCDVVGFNGAAFFQSGKSPYSAASAPLGSRASMEPLFFKAENTQQGVHYAPETSASMEPLFFKAENPNRRPKRRSAGEVASMEPLFFKAENIVQPQRVGNSKRLQWSRFFSKRKMPCLKRGVLSPALSLQWSRFFSKRKIATIFIV